MVFVCERVGNAEVSMFTKITNTQGPSMTGISLGYASEDASKEVDCKVDVKKGLAVFLER